VLKKIAIAVSATAEAIAFATKRESDCAFVVLAVKAAVRGSEAWGGAPQCGHAAAAVLI